MNAVTGAVASLNLTYNGTLLPCSLQKMPSLREGQDQVGFRVFPAAGNPRRERLFASTWNVWYVVEVEFLVPGDFDLSAHLDDYMSWKEALGHKLSDPKALLGWVESVEVTDTEPIDVGMVREGYDFGVLRLVFKTAEDH